MFVWGMYIGCVYLYVYVYIHDNTNNYRNLIMMTVMSVTAPRLIIVIATSSVFFLFLYH